MPELPDDRRDVLRQAGQFVRHHELRVFDDHADAVLEKAVENLRKLRAGGAEKRGDVRVLRLESGGRGRQPIAGWRCGDRRSKP